MGRLHRSRNHPLELTCRTDLTLRRPDRVELSVGGRCWRRWPSGKRGVATEVGMIGAGCIQLAVLDRGAPIVGCPKNRGARDHGIRGCVIIAPKRSRYGRPFPQSLRITRVHHKCVVDHDGIVAGPIGGRTTISPVPARDETVRSTSPECSITHPLEHAESLRAEVKLLLLPSVTMSAAVL